MINFSNLSQLSSHHNYLHSIFGEQQFFFVGGLIRDLLLNRKTNLNDVDVTLAGDPKDIKQLIHHNKQNFSFFETEKYGTMTIIPKSEDKSSSTTQYEITPFRTESNYEDLRHPGEVTWSNSLLEDAKRRDFTINCMYYCFLSNTPDKSSGTTEYETDSSFLLSQLEKQGYALDISSQTLILQDHTLIQEFQDGILESELIRSAIHVLIDPYFGLQDLIKQKLQAVGTPDQRFQEDALRLVRALRFAVALQFDFEKHTRTSVQKNAHLIRKVAKERIKQECDKVFADHNPFGFVALLDKTNLLKRIFPKLYDNKNIEQPIRYHPFDVYTHSLMVLYHLQKLSIDPILRYAALYHDVGKIEQYSSYAMKLDEEGLRSIFGSWLNHVICGEEFAREDFGKLAASKKEIDTIAWYVRHHMMPGEIARGNPLHYHKKVRQLIAQVGPEMTKNLFFLTIADTLGQYNPLQEAQVNTMYTLIDLVDQLIDEEGRFCMKELCIDGTILMKELQIVAGPELGRLLQKAFEWVMEDPKRNEKSILIPQIKTRFKKE